jgi:hypothetical protein
MSIYDVVSAVATLDAMGGRERYIRSVLEGVQGVQSAVEEKRLEEAGEHELKSCRKAS